MKNFIVGFLFVAATFLPILFVPLLAITILIVLVAGPYVTTHVRWFESNQKLEHR